MYQAVRNSEGEIIGVDYIVGDEHLYQVEDTDFVSPDPVPFEGCCESGYWDSTDGIEVDGEFFATKGECIYCGGEVPDYILGNSNYWKMQQLLAV